MAEGRQSAGLLHALGWLLFPAVPVVCESLYNGALILVSDASGLPPDPRDWNTFNWLLEIGPLLGFGFLVGATLDLPEAPGGLRWPWTWLSRRSIWVALGPWSGATAVLAAIGWYYALPSLPESFQPRRSALMERLEGTWLLQGIYWAALILLVITLGYGWLLTAWAVVRRSRREGTGRTKARIVRGVQVALAFVVSLFGSFWAITEGWRGHFFDSRTFPVVLAALTLVTLEGCASTLTYGEVRRRELFHALLLAWVFGLALLWLWTSRRRR